jgi:mannose-6-phosphate isomerase-like protein (cupin superfamily)
MGSERFLVLPPSDHRLSRPALPDPRLAYRVWAICDEQTPTVALQVGVIELSKAGDKCPLHYHSSVEELQYILSGYGVVRDPDGKQYEVGPGTAIYCAPGPGFAHEFENTGPYPLVLMFIHSTAGGESPDLILVDR